MHDGNEITAYQFGPYTIKATTRRFQRGGETIPLTVKLFDILLLLVRNHGQVVTKEALFNEVWPDSYVEENNLAVAVSALRKILGETPREHEYIETIPKRGYRFVAPVRELQERSYTPKVNRESGDDALVGENNAAILSLAVLPLVNANNDPALEYLTDGVTENIINRFSKLLRLHVMARSTVFRYKGKDVDPLEVGRELQVQAVLTGNVVHLDDLIVIGLELVNVDDGAQLWGEQYKLNFSSIFEVQEQVVTEVSDNLGLRLTMKEQSRLRTDYRENSEAYRFYLKGRYFLGKRVRDNIQKGIEYFQKAVEVDAGYAQAYTGMADCYSLLGSYGLMPEREALELARPLAERALAMNANLAEGHASLGFIKSCGWDWSGAEKHFKRAIQLQPAYLQARHWYSLLLMWQGRFEQAQKELEYNLSVSPLSANVNASLGVLSLFTRRYGLAVAWCQEALELEPSFYSAYFALGLAYLQQGMHREAVAAHEAVLNISNEPEALSILGYTYARTGRGKEARQIIRRLEELSRDSYIKPYHLAIIYVGLEERGPALRWLEKALADRNDLTTIINLDPRFDDLRNDPRLVGLLQKMGFPQPSPTHHILQSLSE